MVVKDKFVLLKDLPNVLKLSSTEVKKCSIELGERKLYAVLKLVEGRINHFTKKKVFELVSEARRGQLIQVLNLPNYVLPVSYNGSTRTAVINLESFGTDDISRVDPRNIYACVVYAICFSSLINGSVKVRNVYYSPIVNFLLSVFIRMFGKEFGLLGAYAIEIPKLKFLLACYIQGAFFGVTNQTEMYKKAGTSSGFDFRDRVQELKAFDFSNIEDFIEALSKTGVMPGINRYRFAGRVLRRLSMNFLPALEDLSRFISVLTTSSIPGTTIVPTSIFRYNEREFAKVLEISKVIFR